MGATWSIRLVANAVGPCLLAFAARADDLPGPADLQRPASASALSSTSPAPWQPGAATPVSLQASGPGATEPALARPDGAAAGLAVADPAAERGSVQERLKGIPDNEKEATAATRALRAVLKERLDWLDQWDKATKERADAENPRPTPEQQAAEWKADLGRIIAALAETVKDPDALLPPAFRSLPAEVPEKLQSEMKEAIDAAQADLKDCTSRLEQFRTEPSRKDSTALAAIRASRDKIHQRVSGLKTRNAVLENEVAGAKTPEARTLARERQVNFQWESRVEVERLKEIEARLTLETKRSELAVLQRQVLDAHVQLAQQTLDRMKTRYRTLAARQESDLHRAAVVEKSRARQTDDPLVRFEARRTAELLDLEARVLATENARATATSPTLEEQRTLADKAVNDLTSVKHLLDDGRISHFEAVRLTNDFRRIGAERARIVHDELAVAASRLATAESALGDVEMELIYDARDDRFELDALLDKLPRPLHPKAVALFDELERKHVELLRRRREALRTLARRAEETHEQILRRLSTLEEHFGFIRTNLFWVRDAEPLGTATVAQLRRESWQLGRVGSRMSELLADATSWGRISPEFLAAVVGLVVLPWPLLKVSRTLRSLEAFRSGDDHLG
jgi:hypothetical protein